MSQQPAPPDTVRYAERLATAPVIREPFAHAMVPDVLDPAMFQELRAGFPTPERLAPIVERRADKNYSDKRLTVPLRTMAEAEPDGPWARFADQILTWPVAARLLKAYLPAFQPVQKRHFGDRRVGYDFFAELVYDATGFALGPHTDATAKCVTVLLYFADDEDPEDLGTALYRPRAGAVAEADGALGLGFEGFEEVSRAPYRANTGLIFARTDTSFHGVPSTTSPVPRRLMQYSVFVAGAAPDAR